MGSDRCLQQVQKKITNTWTITIQFRLTPIRLTRTSCNKLYGGIPWLRLFHMPARPQMAEKWRWTEQSDWSITGVNWSIRFPQTKINTTQIHRGGKTRTVRLAVKRLLSVVNRCPRTRPCARRANGAAARARVFTRACLKTGEAIVPIPLHSQSY